MNLAARAGHWSAAHWKTATFGWLALVAAAVVLGAMAGTKPLTDAEQSTGETARAERILADAGFDKRAGEQVLVQARRAGADPRSAAAVVAARLRSRTEVTRHPGPPC